VRRGEKGNWKRGTKRQGGFVKGGLKQLEPQNKDMKLAFFFYQRSEAGIRNLSIGRGGENHGIPVQRGGKRGGSNYILRTKRMC